MAVCLGARNASVLKNSKGCPDTYSGNCSLLTVATLYILLEKKKKIKLCEKMFDTLVFLFKIL